MTLQTEIYDQLFQRFLNSIRLIVEKKQLEAAQRMIRDIQSEWQRRRGQGDAVVDYDRPERGLLAALGYHVGHNQGQSSEVRRLILKYVLEGELPMIHSAEYMKEWGEPNSSTRFQKLARFLGNMVEGNQAKPNSQLAVKQWREDLDWLEAYPHSGDGS
jgi:hypothetical protein